MASIITFFQKLFSKNTDKMVFLQISNGWVIINPSNEELAKIESEHVLVSKAELCDSSHIMHPLNPLNIKCGSTLGMSMMCIN